MTNGSGGAPAGLSPSCGRSPGGELRCAITGEGAATMAAKMGS